MKQTKICPYCNTVFVTELNSKKYCKSKCASLASHRRKQKLKKHLCLWCGQVFDAKRKRKFCDRACRNSFEKQQGIYLKKEIRVPVRITVNDVAKECKKSGLSYGRYVCMKKLQEALSYGIVRSMSLLRKGSQKHSVLRRHKCAFSLG